MNNSDPSLPPKPSHGESAVTARLGADFSALAVQDTRVFKAGKSLAIRIPSAIAKKIALEDGATVEIAVEDGLMYIRKARSRALTDLIDRITPENAHHPIFDNIVGAEHW